MNEWRNVRCFCKQLHKIKKQDLKYCNYFHLSFLLHHFSMRWLFTWGGLILDELSLLFKHVAKWEWLLQMWPLQQSLNRELEQKIAVSKPLQDLSRINSASFRGSWADFPVFCMACRVAQCLWFLRPPACPIASSSAVAALLPTAHLLNKPHSGLSAWGSLWFASWTETGADHHKDTSWLGYLLEQPNGRRFLLHYSSV